MFNAHPNHLPPLKDIKTNRALPSISPWIIGGGWFMAIALTATATLTPVIRYRTVVRAPMTVRPEGELRLVQAPIGGAVVSINVEENQPVEAGQAIATLDSSKLNTRQQQLEASITAAKNQIAQIDEQIALLDEQIATEENRVATSVAIAQANLTGSQRTYSNQQTTTSAEVQAAQANLQLAQQELTSYQQLVAQGAVAQLELAQKQAAVEAASAQLEKLTAELNPTNAEVTVAAEQIAQARSQGAIALSQLNQTQSQLIQQRAEATETLNSSTQELQQTIRDIESTQINAPTAGTIQSLSLRNDDQIVQQGETIAKIFPDSAELTVQALVPAKEISKVKVGQAVKMRLSTCPFSQFGTLPGTVETLPPDILSTPSAENNQANGAFYNITIRPQRSALKAGGQECFIQSGVEGRADIITRKESVLNFILRKANLIENVG